MFTFPRETHLTVTFLKTCPCLAPINTPNS
jgi:hypothetical protein